MPAAIATPEMFRLSDYTCTALQLANFWQDVSTDYARGRIYLPLDDMQRFGVDEATIAQREPTAAFRELLRYEVDYARELFTKGLPLIDLVDRELALDLDLFSRGGLEILHAIERRQYDVLTMRPVISKARKLGLLARALCGKLLPGFSRGRRRGVTPEVQAAYAACRAIARKKAKNFYYAFVALPASKRDAICAVYAFMRQADDLSDDESHSHRRPPGCARCLAWPLAPGAGWRAHQRSCLCSAAGCAAPFCHTLAAARSAGTRHSDGSRTDRFAAYATFADLYRYCYLVASVVGLVCIRIFGYLDPRAEKLAEETGIAFQLTNILRDVREDAERGRLYLPLEDLERCGVTASSMAAISSGTAIDTAATPGTRHPGGARGQFYKSAEALLPLISPDSRAAMWVLVTIYHRLLRHIEQRNFDVFSARIGVPAYEKLSILGCGLFKTLALGVWA